MGGHCPCEWVAEEERSDEDADVVAFEALAGVDAPDLVQAIGLQNPQIPVLALPEMAFHPVPSDQVPRENGMLCLHSPPP